MDSAELSIIREIIRILKLSPFYVRWSREHRRETILRDYVSLIISKEGKGKEKSNARV